MKNLALALAIVSGLIISATIYPQTFVVKEVSETNTVTLISSVGFEYCFTPPGGELLDYEPGDMVSAIMYNAQTPNDIRDDVVMTTRYSGFWLDIPKPEEQTAETVNYVMGGNH